MSDTSKDFDRNEVATTTIDLSTLPHAPFNELQIDITVHVGSQPVARQRVLLTNMGTKPSNELERIGEMARAEFHARSDTNVAEDEK